MEGEGESQSERNWRMSEGVPCDGCGTPSLRFRDGVCWACSTLGRTKQAVKADRQRLIREGRKNLREGRRLV